MLYLITYYNGGTFTSNTTVKKAIVEIKREVVTLNQDMEGRLEAQKLFLADAHNKANRAEVIACMALDMSSAEGGIFRLD